LTLARTLSLLGAANAMSNDRETAIDCVTAAGSILMRYLGKLKDVRIKESLSSVVTEADIAAERHILGEIRQRHPNDNIVAEESGREDRGSDRTWVVDPLDGTSNFAAELPWFGVMVSLLQEGRPVLAATYLPTEDRLYLAELGHGASRNGQQLQVTSETNLGQTLVAYGLDAAAEEARVQEQASFLGALIQRARNVRATNSCVDFAYTIEGRLGACLNFNTKIWDITAPWLLLREAGGELRYLDGRELTFSLDADCCERSYAVIGGPPALTGEISRLATACGLKSS
jgi:myo-inositol-1(or 4)-monophosphatase